MIKFCIAEPACLQASKEQKVKECDATWLHSSNDDWLIKVIAQVYAVLNITADTVEIRW